MASSSIVIKVDFGETLRRFNASINDKKLALGFEALRTKIRNLFNFSSDAAFTLTYVDEDGDAVTLAADDDLNDVGLNPLRLTVKLEKGNPIGSIGTSSTPMRSPEPQLPFGPFPSGLSEFLKSMPEPLRDQLTKLPLELASKTTSSTPVISELAQKLTAAYLKQSSGSMAAPRANTQS
ncbi:hypothetical protein LXL04_027629 [Taraxacum kok-saghyz]